MKQGYPINTFLISVNLSVCNMILLHLDLCQGYERILIRRNMPRSLGIGCSVMISGIWRDLHFHCDVTCHPTTDRPDQVNNQSELLIQVT